MKKLIAIILSVLLMTGTAAALSGCGGGKGDESGDIVVAFLRGGNELADTKAVEAKVSSIVKEKLGFGVKFKTSSIYDQVTFYNNALGAGEELDVINLAFQDPLAYISDRKIQSIDSYLTEKNAPELLTMMEENPSIKLNGLDGKMYGIGTLEIGTCFGGTYTVRKDVLEKAGLYGTGDGQYNDRQKITYTDLTKIFAAIKSTSPTNSSGAAVYPSGNLASGDVTPYFMSFDPLSASPASGVLMGANSTTVTNLYESAEYKAFVQQMGVWQETGYVHSDANTTSSSMTQLLENGQFVGVYLDVPTGLALQYERQYKTDFVQLMVVDPYYMTSLPTISWCVSSQSSRPNKAMQYINLMMTNVELMNTLQYGIEGTHYNVVSEDAYLIDLPEGLTAETSGYYGLPGLYGDKSKIYSWKNPNLSLADAEKERNDSLTVDKAMAEEALASNCSKGLGFIYDSSKQSARIKNIETIISKYKGVLSVGKGTKGSDGTYTGEGSTYAKFISELNKAKISNVITDKNDQFQAWLAKQ